MAGKIELHTESALAVVSASVQPSGFGLLTPLFPFNLIHVMLHAVGHLTPKEPRPWNGLPLSTKRLTSIAKSARTLTLNSNLLGRVKRLAPNVSECA